jgi:hypothetical protein
VGLKAAWNALIGRELQLASGYQETKLLGVSAQQYYPHFVNPEWADAQFDELIQTKGLSIYREMFQRCDQVSCCVRLIQFARLSSGWDVVSVSDDETDKMAAALSRRVMKPIMSRFLMNGMDAFVVGASTQERHWSNPFEYGEWRGYQGYEPFRSLPQETIAYKHDEHGTILPDGVWQAKDKQMVVPSLDPNAFVHMPSDRFVIWSWSRQWDSPYGMSPLRSAYPWYEFKKHIIKSWADYAERYGLPRVRIKIPSNGVTEAEANAAVDRAARYRSKGAMWYRDNTVIDIDDPTTSAVLNYDAGITAANRGIAHSIFLPSTLMDNTDVGSYALGKAQKGVFIWVLDNLGELLKYELVHAGALRPLIDQNFGVEVETPEFTWVDFNQADRESLTRMYDAAARLGLPISESEMRDVLNLREPKDDTDALQVKEQTQIPGGTLPVQTQQVPSEGAMAGLRTAGSDLSAEEAELNALVLDLARTMGDHDGRVDVLRGNGKRTKEVHGRQI